MQHIAKLLGLTLLCFSLLKVTSSYLPPTTYCFHCSLSQGHAVATKARRKHELAISKLPESFLLLKTEPAISISLSLCSLPPPPKHLVAKFIPITPPLPNPSHHHDRHHPSPGLSLLAQSLAARITPTPLSSPKMTKAPQ
jgi:hypothetical protein